MFLGMLLLHLVVFSKYGSVANLITLNIQCSFVNALANWLNLDDPVTHPKY